ncbi:MAG: HAD-IA family hydrolase [archaeon]
MIKLIIFDFDGTLADTKNVILGAMERSFSEFNYHMDLEHVRTGAEPLDALLRKFGVEEKVLPTISKWLSTSFLEKVEDLEPVDGLKALKKLKVEKIVVSNSIHAFIADGLKKFDALFFDGVYGAEDFKNKDEMFARLMKERKITPSELVYVGDRPVDTQLAKRVGCVSIILANQHSWASKEEILSSSPDFIVESLSDIPGLIDKLNKKKN